MKKEDEKHIRRCIELSEKALAKGDNPFGSFIIRKGKVIVEAANKIKQNDVTQHAEIVAMRKAQKLLKQTIFPIVQFIPIASLAPCALL